MSKRECDIDLYAGLSQVQSKLVALEARVAALEASNSPGGLGDAPDNTPGGDMCEAAHTSGLVCTLDLDHDGQHVATGGPGMVLQTWTDPEPVEVPCCDADCPGDVGGYYSCDLAKGHDGLHDNNDGVRWTDDPEPVCRACQGSGYADYAAVPCPACETVPPDNAPGCREDAALAAGRCVMSGAWAREADATDLTHLIDDGRLCDAAWSLAAALALSTPGARDRQLRIASAIIRRERRRLDPEGKVRRDADFAESSLSDESLIWRALRFVTAVDYFSLTSTKATSLREAEAALRTLHKRGRS